MPNINNKWNSMYKFNISKINIIMVIDSIKITDNLLSIIITMGYHNKIAIIIYYTNKAILIIYPILNNSIVVVQIQYNILKEISHNTLLNRIGVVGKK